MACSRVFFVILAIVAVAVAVVPKVTLATEYVVGDDGGWTIGFDYQAWAQGKEFVVGDKLVFKYPQGVHNVYKVNGTGFQNCIVPSQDVPLTSGNDTIVLATPGRKWYICGVGEHCKLGQKLVITVQLSEPQAPSMAPSSPQYYTEAYQLYSDGSRLKAYQLSFATLIVAIVTIFMT